MSISENKTVGILGGCFLIRSALQSILAELKLPNVAIDEHSDVPPDVGIVLICYNTDEALSDRIAKCMSNPDPAPIVLFPQTEALLKRIRGTPVTVAAVVPPTLAAAEIKSVISLVVEGHRILPFATPETEHMPDTGLPDCIQPGLLTARQLEILREVAAGHSNKAIARTLAISINTVEAHVSRIIRKLKVDNRTQAAIVLRGGMPRSKPAFRRQEDASASSEIEAPHCSARPQS